MSAPEDPDELYVPPVNDDGTPRRGPSRAPIIALALVVALVVIVATIAALALLVPRSYSESSSVSLNATNQWQNSVCVPLPSGSTGIEVTFSWDSSGSSVVQLVGWNGELNPFYNVTSTRGSGSFNTGSFYGGADFQAFGVPTLPAFVNISISYQLPGHYLGGPGIPPSC